MLVNLHISLVSFEKRIVYVFALYSVFIYYMETTWPCCCHINIE